MKCAVHNEVDATGYCRNCGKALCAQCVREVRGMLYCETCLADLLAAPQARGNGSPGLAAILSFIPGLGAVYNGQYTKAIIQVAIFAAFVAVLSSDAGDPASAMFGILLAVFYLYMPIDSYRVAKARRMGQEPREPLEGWTKDKPAGAVLLIVIGVLFLLREHLHIGYLFGRFWPVLLILIGVMLLWRRRGA